MESFCMLANLYYLGIRYFIDLIYAAIVAVHITHLRVYLSYKLFDHSYFNMKVKAPAGGHNIIVVCCSSRYDIQALPGS